MAPYTNMPDDVKAMAEETEAKIKSGELKPFTGPITKQDGTEWLKAGESADDGTLLGTELLRRRASTTSCRNKALRRE